MSHRNCRHAGVPTILIISLAVPFVTESKNDRTDCLQESVEGDFWGDRRENGETPLQAYLSTSKVINSQLLRAARMRCRAPMSPDATNRFNLNKATGHYLVLMHQV